jgi:hypothetical protein
MFDWSDAGLTALVVVVLQATKLIQWVKDHTGILPLASLALGVLSVVVRDVIWSTLPVTLDDVRIGLFIGAAAIATYNVAAKTVIPAAIKSFT